jgi:16S rRNA (uracil1498-N3)-methyltransferase
MNVSPGRVPRLYLDSPLGAHSRVSLSDEAAHHAARVLRLADGEAVVLFDGRGGEYAARLSIPSRGRVLADIAEFSPIERESPLSVTLLQAISTSEKMDFTIQKSTELGVAAIQPVLSAKSVVRLSAEREAKKLERWRRVAIAACEQCGRNRIPEIHEPIALEAYRPPADAAKLLLAPAGGAKLSEHARSPLVLAIGPEAGFSTAEEELLRRDGFAAVRLGPRVLRTETAALAALAALNALAGDF